MPTTDLLVLGLFIVLALLALPTLRDLFAALGARESRAETATELAPSN